MVALMNKCRAKKKRLAKLAKNKRKDRIVTSRHNTPNRFDKRMAELYKECGSDGHGSYKSDWYIVENIENDDIDRIMNPKSHSCDYEPKHCQHNEYKARDRVELQHTKDIQTNWALTFKHDLDKDEPIGLTGGIFRKREREDYHLEHVILLDADDVEYNKLYNLKNGRKCVKAHQSDKFSLDFGINGGFIKYVNSCVKDRANVIASNNK